ncbi:MAG TPA: tRNA pseudouridine(55) synthase TruB [Thermoanaerobacterales bacterium]|nr:tRNA pseudouridine(55) synthase TruB [Thermoanaerobacterales bacterium]
MDGILNILKPPGMTSHDVVSYVRRNLKGKKVGHTGTLDPGAAGVLPVCIGKATKISRFIIKSYKEYRAELTLGISTNTQDNFGEITKKVNTVLSKDIVEERIYEAFDKFKGVIYQEPPMYSAIKYKGKPLYKYARSGQIIKREKRKVVIKDIKIVEILYPNRIVFDVICSSGTYIRTLCNDIGEMLGCGGHMSLLIRKSVANFKIDDSITLEEFRLLLYENELIKKIYPIDFPLKDLPYAIIPDNMMKRAKNGSPVYNSHISQTLDVKDEQLFRMYDKNNNFIAIGKLIRDDCLVPVNVFWH